MRGACVPAHRVDSHNEVLFELHAPRYGIFELPSHRRERGLVLLGRFGLRHAHRRGVRDRLHLYVRRYTIGQLLFQLRHTVFGPSHVRLRSGAHPRE